RGSFSGCRGTCTRLRVQEGVELEGGERREQGGGCGERCGHHGFRLEDLEVWRERPACRSRRGVNLIPARVKVFRRRSCCWCDLGSRSCSVEVWREGAKGSWEG